MPKSLDEARFLEGVGICVLCPLPPTPLHFVVEGGCMLEGDPKMSVVGSQLYMHISDVFENYSEDT